MPLSDEQRRAEHAGPGLPTQGELDDYLRERKPNAYRFRDDGETPNNPRLPLVYYRSPLILGNGSDPASIFEALFARNGWNGSWRNGMYEFLHFHTRTHEVLGVARGWANARFGGRKGRVLALRAGDVVVLPAGTGHRRERASADLLIVGAYPDGSIYDEPGPGDVDPAKARRAIANVPAPASDPVFGPAGPLMTIWHV